jgi:hypothetical protein
MISYFITITLGIELFATINILHGFSKTVNIRSVNASDVNVTVLVASVFSKVASVTDIIGAYVKERKQVNPNPRCLNFNKILKK